ncbi:anti-sigma factor antagonist [Amycolatopsis balhimycina DSM 5908]|uniref:Anti-sigma factor antagonist n=1 Tax=Amycolatopsis balhimycina DSM 5908 TaxID=1081091 RepID=A0A428X1G9_AMYBA|nr:STAS domain-containing protein [Amycolatopsis balhimycina]RSM49168.1 anti-sigma factor antagonist [Amycolatopsis balhimycina DSM 5908]
MPSADRSRPDRLTTSRSHGDPAVVTLAGQLDSGTVLIMARAVAQCLAQDPAPEVLVLDLTDVTRLATSAIRVLLHARDHAARCRTTLRITAPRHPGPVRALRISGAHAIFDVYADRRAALAAGDRSSFLELAHRLWTAGH